MYNNGIIFCIVYLAHILYFNIPYKLDSIMKYIIEINVKLTKEELFEKLLDPENLKHWQKDFVAHKHISGIPGETGAKSVITYKMGRRNVDFATTVVQNDLPDEYHVLYESKQIYNYHENYFVQINKDSTWWTVKTQLKFKGLLMGFVGFFIPGLFKKRIEDDMYRFKEYAEREFFMNDDDDDDDDY